MQQEYQDVFTQRHFHESGPNMDLDLHLEKMTSADRDSAADLLRRALELVTTGAEVTHEGSVSKTRSSSK